MLCWCCFQSVKDIKFESNSQPTPTDNPFIEGCFQSVKDIKFESNSQPACSDGKGNRRIYETTDIVDAYVKHVAAEEQIPYAYVRIRQDTGTGKLIVQYTEPRLEFPEGIHCGKRRKYLQYAVEDIYEWRPISLSDKKSQPAWRPIISDVLVTPAGDFKITAQSWWEMLQRIGHMNIEKAFDTLHDNIYISMKIYRHPYKWNWY